MTDYQTPSDVKPVYSGKVRDVYDAGDNMVMITSDRVSAFDVVLPDAIPNRGRVLTALTEFWLTSVLADIPNHLISTDSTDAEKAAPQLIGTPGLVGRTMLVRKAQMTPIEWIVRGYLAGSAWREYQKSGTIHGMKAPAGLKLGSRLPEPMLTPSTKAEIGIHDENLSINQAVDRVGQELVDHAGAMALNIYKRANEWAAQRGIILADTKFELGWIDGKLSLCDEVLTPDSSRYWPLDKWQTGSEPPGYDKEFLRSWLSKSDWNKEPPGPRLPEDVIRNTRDRYIEVYERISGRSFNDWPGVI